MGLDSNPINLSNPWKSQALLITSLLADDGFPLRTTSASIFAIIPAMIRGGISSIECG